MSNYPKTTQPIRERVFCLVFIHNGTRFIQNANWQVKTMELLDEISIQRKVTGVKLMKADDIRWMRARVCEPLCVNHVKQWPSRFWNEKNVHLVVQMWKFDTFVQLENKVVYMCWIHQGASIRSVCSEHWYLCRASFIRLKEDLWMNVKFLSKYSEK